MNEARYEDNLQLALKTRTSAVGHAFLLIISVLNVRTPENTSLVLVLATLILVLSLGRVAMGRPGPDRNERALGLWFYPYASMTIGTALAWGLLCAESIASRGPGDRATLLLLIVNAGIAAAGSNSLSANRRLASLFTFAGMAPVAMALAYHDLAGYWPVVAMLATYQVFLVLQIEASNVMIRQLREREHQYRTLVDATHEAVVVHRDGSLLEANAAFERTFGYAPRSVVGSNIYDLLHPADRDEAVRLARQGDGSRRVARVRHLDGRYLTVELRGRNLLYQGQPARVTCVNDITTQLAAEDSLLQSVQQRHRLAQDREDAAREAWRLKSEFLANVGHEMRTPLNGIIGLTDLLADAPAGDLRKQYLDRLRTSGQALLTLISDLLDFTEIDAGRIEFADAPFSLPQLLEGICAERRPLALAKNLVLTREIGSDLPPWVRGDAERVGQIVSHVLNNALKFTDAGRVELRCRTVARDAVTARVRIEIQDTGIGVPPELAVQLFNPFTQGDGSTSRRHGGTGLGLSICRRLLDAMGGQIGFSGAPSGGTCFWFELPLAISEARPATTNSRSNAALPAARVLVVEDNSTNQVLIMAVLASLGLRASAVENGVECLRALSEGTFDLVLMDCQMPEMDGFEATRRIRAREAAAGGRLPIVALTANVMQEDRERCFAAGMDGFVAKPVKRDALVAELSRFLGGRDAKAS